MNDRVVEPTAYAWSFTGCNGGFHLMQRGFHRMQPRGRAQLFFLFLGMFLYLYS